MDKIKKYIDCYIPTETCNLRCKYCYITQQRKFNNKLAKFTHTPEEIRQALSVNRLEGKCLINLCAGGETLLVEEIIPIVVELLKEGHYIMIVTNGTLDKRFDELAKIPKELLERLFFKFSFHYLELLRIQKLDNFFDNINKMKKAGAAYTVEVTPNDELIPYIETLKEICIEKLGAQCHITIARNDNNKKIEVLSKYSLPEYVKIWDEFNSELLRFKSQIFYKKRKEFCYAGDWSYYIDLVTGQVRQCYVGSVIQNLYDDIDKPLKKLPIGNSCPQPHCYNGHSFLVLGDIPELETPFYSELRNRISNDKTEWLTPAMKSFMSTKLKDSNVEYNKEQKNQINRQNKKLKIINFNNRVKNKMKRVLKKDVNNG